MKSAQSILGCFFMRKYILLWVNNRDKWGKDEMNIVGMGIEYTKMKGQK